MLSILRMGTLCVVTKQTQTNKQKNPNFKLVNKQRTPEKEKYLYIKIKTNKKKMEQNMFPGHVFMKVGFLPYSSGFSTSITGH